MSLNPKIRDWHGRRVWLMGASSGMGAALAIALANEGACVAVSGRRAAAVDEVVRNLPLHELSSSIGHIGLVCDASNPKSLAEAKAELLAVWGGVDIAIYLAGDYQPQQATDFSLATLRHLCEVNYLAAAAFAECVLPLWLNQAAEAERGLVLVGSVAGYRGLPKALGYGPSKAALIHFAEVLYLDLHARGLGVWLVNPGFVATRLTDKNDFKMPALISTEVAAKALLKGMAGGGFEIHFPRRFTCVMRLLRLLPYSVYFRLVKKITGV